MANTKSAIKRTRKIKRQTAVNRSRKSRYRSALKKMNSIIEKKDIKLCILDIGMKEMSGYDLMKIIKD